MLFLSNITIYAENNKKDNYFSELYSLPEYNCVFVPIKNTNQSIFSNDFLQCIDMDGPYYHIGLEYMEKYDDWEAVKKECISFSNKEDIKITSFDELRKTSPVGICVDDNHNNPSPIYKINNHVLVVEDFHCKYDANGNMVSYTKDKQLISYRVCNRIESAKLYKNCWYESDGYKYYIGNNGLPITGNKTIGGIRYMFNQYGQCRGTYTGWAKNSKGKVYYKNGVKVTKNTTIKGIRYKFNKNGICTGKYTGFVKNSKGKRYYKNGVLLKGQTITVKGLTYYADSFGYLTAGEEDDVTPGSVFSNVRDLMYNGSNYYLFIETAAFIYGDDGKCYVLGDLPDEVGKSGYKIKSDLIEDKELTTLIKDKKPLGQLTYTSQKINNNFEITVKEFDKANLYANGRAMEDYGLTVVSTEPFCYVDGTAVYLYTTAAKY